MFFVITMGQYEGQIAYAEHTDAAGPHGQLDVLLPGIGTMQVCQAHLSPLNCFQNERTVML